MSRLLITTIINILFKAFAQCHLIPTKSCSCLFAAPKVGKVSYTVFLTAPRILGLGTLKITNIKKFMAYFHIFSWKSLILFHFRKGSQEVIKQIKKKNLDVTQTIFKLDFFKTRRANFFTLNWTEVLS